MEPKDLVAQQVQLEELRQQLATEMKKIEILLDNGGGLLLQTAKFVHNYDSATQAAEDIKNFLAGADTSDWEGNEPECRREPGGEDKTLDRADIEAIIRAGEAIARVGRGYTCMELVVELLGHNAAAIIHETNDEKSRHIGFADAEEYWTEMGRSLRRSALNDSNVEYAYRCLVSDPDTIDDAERFMSCHDPVPALGFPSKAPAALVRGFREGATK